MSNKTTWTIIAIIAVVLILAGIVYWRLGAPDSEDQSLDAEQLNQALEQSNDATQVDIPSVNPLDAALPDVNPLEAANPFSNIRTNPF